MPSITNNPQCPHHPSNIPGFLPATHTPTHHSSFIPRATASCIHSPHPHTMLITSCDLPSLSCKTCAHAAGCPACGYHPRPWARCGPRSRDPHLLALPHRTARTPWASAPVRTACSACRQGCHAPACEPPACTSCTGWSPSSPQVAGSPSSEASRLPFSTTPPGYVRQTNAADQGGLSRLCPTDTQPETHPSRGRCSRASSRPGGQSSSELESDPSARSSSALDQPLRVGLPTFVSYALSHATGGFSGTLALFSSSQSM